MFGLVTCNASILARQRTDPQLFFVRTLVKHWLWPIITCFGVTGNILAVIVLTKRRMIMSSTNNYLAALALVDIAYLILTLIMNTLQHPCFKDTSISDILSTICRPIVDFSSNTSVWLTVTFTVERWVAISYPLQSRTWCTVNRARKIIMSVMCAALICTSPSAFEMKLVRITEIKNATDSDGQPINTSRISAAMTALGNSSLYKTIYFTFVAFAIIWIPLLFLCIFNTMLIIYVHRSKQNEQESSQGIKLRRHNQGNQGEQRKTTIMLIAVVLVFTICQIPQAISLTVQSFSLTPSHVHKVLILNNFANCLVAINASMNFFLYCCFSDRFRSTFSSHFSFLTKYCTPYFMPNWKLKINKNQHSISTDNMSNNHHFNPSNYSLAPQILPGSRSPNLSYEANRKLNYKSLTNSPRKQSEALNKKFASSSVLSSNTNKKDTTDSKNILFKQTAETCPKSPFARATKKSSSVDQRIVHSNSSINRHTPFRYSVERSPKSHPSVVLFTNKKDPSKYHSSSIHTLTPPTYYPCSSEQLQNTSSNVNKTEIRQSQQSLNDKTTEEIWIKRNSPNNTLETNCDRQKLLLWKDIVDVTV